MRKPRSGFLFVTFLFLGMALWLPAEDVPETNYDESETLPCEITEQFIISPDRLRAGGPAGFINRVSASVCGRITAYCGRAPQYASLPMHSTEDISMILSHSLRC